MRWRSLNKYGQRCGGLTLLFLPILALFLSCSQTKNTVVDVSSTATYTAVLTATAQVEQTSTAQVAVTATTLAEVAAAPTVFASHLNDYLQIPNLQVAPDSSKIYIIGKIIPIDLSPTLQVDIDLYAALPAMLRATTPAEVGTIIWLSCLNNQVGTYSDGAAAYQLTCRVTIVDKVNSIEFSAGSFDGPFPPFTKTQSGSASGGEPIDAIIAYINGLPKK